MSDVVTYKPAIIDEFVQIPRAIVEALSGRVGRLEVKRFISRIIDHTQQDVDRFWSKVDTSAGPDACWPWLRGKHHGYGGFQLNRKSIDAHVFSFVVTKGQIPDNKMVCHTCDFPACCNPEHLYAGTYQSNMDDKVNRGRQSFMRGIMHGVARLTDKQVREIRQRAGENQRRLAAEFGVTQPLVSKIIRRHIWRHV